MPSATGFMQRFSSIIRVLPIPNIELSGARSGTIDPNILLENWKTGKLENHMAKTLSKTVRVTEELWNRVEGAARKHNESPNHLLVKLAMEALDRREWPRTELEIQLLRSTLFTAQAMARNMIAKGRGEEIEDIRREISSIVPDLPSSRPKDSE